MMYPLCFFKISNWPHCFFFFFLRFLKCFLYLFFKHLFTYVCMCVCICIDTYSQTQAAPSVSWGTWDLWSLLQHAGFFFFVIIVVSCRIIFTCVMWDYFSSFGMWALTCNMWNLVPWAGIEPRPPALGVWSLSYWTTREVPRCFKFGATFLKRYLEVNKNHSYHLIKEM